MGFVEAAYLILGMFLGIAGIAVVRWVLLRPVRKAMGGDLIEQLNTFSVQIRRLNERMRELTRSMESGRRNVLTGDDVEIGETMSEMNRLLHEINDFFIRDETEAAAHASDFAGPEEEEKFEHMEQISDDEIARTDWDKLIDRLREENDGPRA